MTRVILVYGLDNVKTFLVLCGRQFITTDSEMKGLNPGGGIHTCLWDPYLDDLFQLCKF